MPVDLTPLPPLHLPILLQEKSGIPRHQEPVTVGLPLPQGMAFDPACFTLWSHDQHPLAVQAQVLARWVDQSIQWVLLDFQATVDAHQTLTYHLRYATEPTPHPASITMQQFAERIVVDTGAAIFTVNTTVWRPFESVMVHGTELLAAAGSSMLCTDTHGTTYLPVTRQTTIEATGPLRLTLAFQGTFTSTAGTGLADFMARLSFYANHPSVELQFTLRNPRAAQHPGGLWDLGDTGSIYFQDLTLHIPYRPRKPVSIAWTPTVQQKWQQHKGTHLEIYQDSSGGENWQSPNHVNRFGRIAQRFPGYRVTADEVLVHTGARATPLVGISDGDSMVTGTMAQFWQHFPKAVSVQENSLLLSVFPQQYQDVYELQGGEQKTHTLFVDFASPSQQTFPLAWVHNPLLARTTPEAYAASKAFAYLVPQDQDPNTNYINFVSTAVTGSNTFFDRREIIDEYGWRHFGDLYADHEAVHHTDATPFISHYNNQYDVIYGALVHYVRSHESRWFALASDLAKHVIDIDIYHTQADKPSYNGGMFWHTDHYTDAATSTHRTYSKASMQGVQGHTYGGGPSNEQNYTTGLLYYYFLTGSMLARDAVLELANWVLNMDDGRQRRGGFLDRRATGFGSATTERTYHGPGRGSGNSINALLDAYTLTQQPIYLGKAEEFIRRCIHPHDDIAARHLEDVEHRWSYTVFLQILGKYLDTKAAQGAIDTMYRYARASLLHYATWMAEHEVSYQSVLHRVKIPTETWPAQDIRKCNVFQFAAKHADEPWRTTFLQKADTFFQICLQDVLSYRTCYLTRPLVLLITNGFMRAYFQNHPTEQAPPPMPGDDFGKPQSFTPQFAEIYQLRQMVRTFLHTLQSITQHARGSWRCTARS